MTVQPIFKQSHLSSSIVYYFPFHYKNGRISGQNRMTLLRRAAGYRFTKKERKKNDMVQSHFPSTPVSAYIYNWLYSANNVRQESPLIN